MATANLFLPALVLSATVLTLAACGGGGGGSSQTVIDTPTTPLAITVANSTEIASVINDTTTTLADMGETSGMIATSIGVMPHATGNSLVGRTLDAVRLAWRAPPGGEQVLSGATRSETLACDVSGNVTLTIDDADNNGEFSNGDSVSIAFNNCNDGDSDGVASGGMSLRLNASSGDPSVPDTSWSFSMTLTFSAMTWTNAGNSEKADGAVTLAASYAAATTLSTASMSGSSLAFTWTVNNIVHKDKITNFSLVDTFNDSTNVYALDYDFTFASTELGGVIGVVTNPPFSGLGSGYPSSGMMKVTGKDNASVTLEAMSDGQTVQISTDENGDGVADDVKTVNWSDL